MLINGACAGELTKGSMQRVINILTGECNLTQVSLFVDVGSGLGKPPLHVAQVASPQSPLRYDARSWSARRRVRRPRALIVAAVAAVAAIAAVAVAVVVVMLPLLRLHHVAPHAEPLGPRDDERLEDERAVDEDERRDLRGRA